MQAKIYETGDMIRVLKIKADASDLEEYIELEIKKIKSQGKLRGFRPEKVPNKMVLRIFGKDIENFAVNNLCEEVVHDMIVSKDEYQVIGKLREITREYTLGEDLLVRIEFFVVPQIQLKDFRGHTIDAPIYEITDELVERHIKCLFTQKLSPRPLKSDEPIGISPEGEFDQVVYQVRKIDPVTRRVLLDGSAIESKIHNFIGIDHDTLNKSDDYRFTFVGKFLGDEIPHRIKAHPQDNFLSTYQVTIKEAYRYDFPEIDDQWAKILSENEIESVNEFYQWMTDAVHASYDEYSSGVIYSEIKRHLIKLHPYSLPSNLIDCIGLDDEIVKEASENEYYKNMILYQYRWDFFVNATHEQLEKFLTVHATDSEPVQKPMLQHEFEGHRDLMMKLIKQFDINYHHIRLKHPLSDRPNKWIDIQRTQTKTIN